MDNFTNRLPGLPIKPGTHLYGTPVDGDTRLYAFIATTGKPQIMEFEDDREGHRRLADVIRCETVLAVIRGQRVEFGVESVVNLTIYGERIRDRLPLGDTHGA